MRTIWDLGAVRNFISFRMGSFARLCLCVVFLAPMLSFALMAQETNSPVRRQIVVLGDSIAAGYGLDASEAFPALLQTRLDAAKLPYVMTNAGLSGDTSAGGLRRIDWLLRRPMDVLILELGGNDGLRGIDPKETRTNLQSIVARVRQKQPEVKIVLAGMQMPPNMGAAYTAAFQKIYPELAQELGLALIPFLLEGVGGREELNQPDQIHPTAAGQKILAENVWKVLEGVLRQVGKKN